MPIARILRRFIPSATDLTDAELAAFEAEILAVLQTLTIQQRQAVQSQLSAIPQPGGLWLLVSLIVPL